MDLKMKEIIWNQFGAAIDMLENALHACPEKLWGQNLEPSEFWYRVYHTLFWLDFYLSDSIDGFVLPAPFTFAELDPAGLLPERVYTKKELENYLDHCSKKCRTTVKTLSDEKSRQHFRYGSIDLSFAELLLYNMRHVQHHTAQLNLLLRQEIDSAPSWVKQTKINLNGE
jgi:DinB superfamily